MSAQPFLGKKCNRLLQITIFLTKYDTFCQKIFIFVPYINKEIWKLKT